MNHFYIAPEFGSQPFGVALEEKEHKLIEENASVLLGLTKGFYKFLPNNDLRATLNRLTLTSLQETEFFASAICWSD